MDSEHLGRLRPKRRFLHRQLDRYEPPVERLCQSLEKTNAAINAITPELSLPPRIYRFAGWSARINGGDSGECHPLRPL
jgi:hypothetical protein